MKNILYYGYNKKDYETAIKNFAQGSNMNYKNTYVNAGYIQDTLPLMKPPLIALFDSAPVRCFHRTLLNIKILGKL